MLDATLKIHIVFVKVVCGVRRKTSWARPFSLPCASCARSRLPIFSRARYNRRTLLRRRVGMIDLQGLFSEKAHFLRFCFVCAAVVSGYSPHIGQQLVVLLEFPPHQL